MSQNLPGATDVFVIGGGPAGLAAAIAARQRGFEVLVADGGQPPIDKTCGEGLLPDGLAALEQLGIHLPVAASHPFCGIRFLSAALSADASFPEKRSGIALRRTTLHRLMMERAEQLGAGLMWRTAVTGISANGVHLADRMVRSRWIVGADGSNSRVRRWAGLDRGPRPRLRYAFRRHFCAAAWSDHMEVYWGDRCQGYATAVSREQVCVALASHEANLRLEEGLQALPRLRARLNGAEAVSTERGAVTGNREYRRVWRDKVVLIGDASGTVDAITGEGLGLAFSQAVALAESLDRADLSLYEAEHRRLALRPLWMARLMLTLDGRPRLQHRTLQVFQKNPEIFRRLLALHVGAMPPLHLLRDGLTLGWGLFTA
jgi:menaquinone-9 beta-reductase